MGLFEGEEELKIKDYYFGDGVRFINSLKIVLIAKDLYEPPFYSDKGSAGFDLKANGSFVVLPGQKIIIPTGVKMAIPQGFCGLLCSRSGMVAKTDTNVENSPGIIDSSYRGEIGVIFKNHNSKNPYRISRGDRIAQLVIVPVASPQVEIVESLDDTERGEGGFGHTGK